MKSLLTRCEEELTLKARSRRQEAVVMLAAMAGIAMNFVISYGQPIKVSAFEQPYEPSFVMAAVPERQAFPQLVYSDLRLP